MRLRDQVLTVLSDEFWQRRYVIYAYVQDERTNRAWIFNRFLKSRVYKTLASLESEGSAFRQRVHMSHAEFVRRGGRASYEFRLTPKGRAEKEKVLRKGRKGRSFLGRIIDKFKGAD